MNVDSEGERTEENEEEEESGLSQGGETPHFDVTNWEPHSSDNLDYKSEYDQCKLMGKVKASTVHRQQRLKDFKNGLVIRRNAKDEKCMMSAANKNDYVSVLKYLESGIDACAADEKKRTALHFSAAQGNVLVAKILLEKGADPNQTDILGNTPLHLAVCTNHVPMVTLLLKAGTNTKAIHQCGRRLLLLAKSRLLMMPKNLDLNSEKHRKEALQLTEMLLEYLSMTGWDSDVQQLEYMRNLLQNSTCSDMDNVNSLLTEFTNLAIDRPVA